MLVGGLAAIALLEAALRVETPGLWPAVVVELVLIVALLWRRAHPGLVVLIGFGTVLLTDLVRQLAGIPSVELYTGAFLLILPYTLVRWGSGREIIVVGALMLTAMAATFLTPPFDLGDLIGGVAVVTASVTLGAVFRARAALRAQRAEQVRLEERARLARELHDTVAHHVSAITLSAQAALATADSETGPVVDRLRVIESSAEAALRDMRSVVHVLRDGDAATRVPGIGVADLQALAATPDVSLDVVGDPASVPAPIMAALYRLVQEAITNARTHAVSASGIEVFVTIADDAVHARVHDDGAATGEAGGGARGFGVIGMIERAELLGGTCRAGADPAGGWTVEAELPLHRGIG